MFSRPCGSFDFAFGFRAPKTTLFTEVFYVPFSPGTPPLPPGPLFPLCSSPTCRCSCCHPRVHCHVAHHCHHHDDAVRRRRHHHHPHACRCHRRLRSCIYVSLYLLQLEVNLLCKSMCLRLVSTAAKFNFKSIRLDWKLLLHRLVLIDFLIKLSSFFEAVCLIRMRL